MKNNILTSKIFIGLKNLNDGFDSQSIYYFSEVDFEIVLNRVEENNIGIYGIEPWLEKRFYDVLTHEDYNTYPENPEWYKKAFIEFRNLNKGLIYAATYKL